MSIDDEALARLRSLHTQAESSQFFVMVTPYVKALHEALPALLDNYEAVARADFVTMTAGDNPETMEPCAEILDVFPEAYAGRRFRIVPCTGGAE